MGRLGRRDDDQLGTLIEQRSVEIVWTAAADTQRTPTALSRRRFAFVPQWYARAPLLVPFLTHGGALARREGSKHGLGQAPSKLCEMQLRVQLRGCTRSVLGDVGLRAAGRGAKLRCVPSECAVGREQLGVGARRKLHAHPIRRPERAPQCCSREASHSDRVDEFAHAWRVRPQSWQGSPRPR